MEVFVARITTLAVVLVVPVVAVVAGPCAAGDACVITPGPGWLPEGERCDDSGTPDTVNGGCGSDPVVFSPLACGDDVLGASWARDGWRDVDWYAVALPAAGLSRTVTVELTAEFPARLLRFGVDPTCWDLPVDFLEVAPCVSGELSIPLPAGSGTWFVVQPTWFDGLPCGGGGNAYHLRVRCDPPVCPADGDADGVIGLTDLLRLLAHWGPCPEPGVPCPADGDVDRDGDVDFGDLLELLGSFGPCP